MLGCVNQYFGPFQCVLDHFHIKETYSGFKMSHTATCVCYGGKKTKLFNRGSLHIFRLPVLPLC